MKNASRTLCALCDWMATPKKNTAADTIVTLAMMPDDIIETIVNSDMKKEGNHGQQREILYALRCVNKRFLSACSSTLQIKTACWDLRQKRELERLFSKIVVEMASPTHFTPSPMILGEGGQATVYAAYLEGNTVAWKIFDKPTSDLNRMQREVDIMQRLHTLQNNNNNQQRMLSVRVLWQGNNSYAMPFCHGSLQSACGCLSADQVFASVVKSIAKLLAIAHRDGIVHHDIKPSNILVTANGKIVLGDWGLAHARDFPPLTQVGAVMGTLGFMAPEQSQGERGNSASDIFALGKTVEALANQQALSDERIKRFVALCTIANEPSRRPTAQAIADFDFDSWTPRRVVMPQPLQQPQQQVMESEDVWTPLIAIVGICAVGGYFAFRQTQKNRDQ